MSEAAKAARNVPSYADFDQLRFIARVGVRPPEGAYPAKNTILEVITPDRRDWKKPDQISVTPPTDGGGNPPKTTPPAGAIVRPEWGR